MSTIKFKRTSGSTGPTGLTFGEPAYVQGLKSLYIGQTAGDPALRIGAEVSTDGTLTSNSDNKIPTEKAVRTYVSNNSSASGVTGIVAGTGISVSGQTGNVTVTNTGVLSLNGSTGAVVGVSSVLGMTGEIAEIPAFYRDDIYLYPTEFSDATINYASKSNYINESPWTFSGLTLSKNLTDPFGVTNNAWTVTRNAINTTSTLEQYFSTIVSPIGSVSFYVQAIQGSTYVSTPFGLSTQTYIPAGAGSTFYAEIIGGTGTITGNGTTSLGVTGLTYTQWTRIFVKNGIDLPIYAFRMDRTINYVGASGSSIGFFGLQYETGLSATSYVDNNTTSPKAGSGNTYNAIGVSYDSTIAATNKANTFTSLQTLSSGLNVSGGVTFNNTLYVSGNVSSGSDVSANTFTLPVNSGQINAGRIYGNWSDATLGVFANTDEFASLYIEGNQEAEQIILTSGSVNYTTDIDNYSTYSKIKLKNNAGDDETKIELRVNNKYYDAGVDDYFGITAAYIGLSNPFTEGSSGSGQILLYSTDKITIQPNNGLVVQSGATFTGNIYAPNIVNSFNGNTGAVQGVSAAVAGTGISVSGATGSVTISNTGVLSFNGSTGAVVGVASINGSTGAITNVARINEGNTFTVRQVMNAGATMSALYVANGITFNGTRFELRSNSNPVIIGQNASTTNLKLTATNTSALIPLDPFINFVGGDTDASTNSIIYIDSGSITSGLGRVDINTNVLGITANQTLRGTLNVTGLGTFNTGITAAGATFTSSINLLGSLLINGSNGSSNQVLSSTGSGITWATASGGGLSWSTVTADRSLVAEEGVLANKSSGTLTLTLPTTAALGKVIRVSGMQNTWRIAQNASQKIHFGKITTTTGVGGYLENSNAKDAVELVCCVANLEWNVISSIGNITIV